MKVSSRCAVLLIVLAACQTTAPSSVEPEPSTPPVPKPSEPLQKQLKGLDSFIARSGAVVTADVDSFDFAQVQGHKVTVYRLCGINILNGDIELPIRDGCLSVSAMSSYLVVGTHYLLFLNPESPYHAPTIDGELGAFATADKYGRSCARRGQDELKYLKDGYIPSRGPIMESRPRQCVSFQDLLNATVERIKMVDTKEQTIPEDWRFEPPD